MKFSQSRPTLCDPMDCNLLGFSVHRIFCLWNSCPGKNTGVGSLPLLQRIFPTQGSNPGLPHCRQILYQLSYQGSPHTLLMEKQNCTGSKNLNQQNYTCIFSETQKSHFQESISKVHSETCFSTNCKSKTVAKKKNNERNTLQFLGNLLGNKCGNLYAHSNT